MVVLLNQQGKVMVGCITSENDFYWEQLPGQNVIFGLAGTRSSIKN
jgi:hypothetical protein